MKGRQIRFKQPRRDNGNHLREEHTCRQPRRKSEQTDEERLGKQYSRDASALHAEQQVQPKLLFPPLHQKTVGIDDEKAEHHSHEDGNVSHDDDHLFHVIFLRFAQRDHGLLGVNGVEHVKQADAERKRQEINGKVTDTAGNIAQSQLTEHERRHLPAGTRPQ